MSQRGYMAQSSLAPLSLAPAFTMLIGAGLLVQLILVSSLPASRVVGKTRARREDSFEQALVNKRKRLHEDPRTEIILPNGCCAEHREPRHLAVELTAWDDTALEQCVGEYVDKHGSTGAGTYDPTEEWSYEEIKLNQTGAETAKSQRMVFRAACINQCAAKRSETAMVMEDDRLDREMIVEAVEEMDLEPWQKTVLDLAVSQCTRNTQGKELRNSQTGGLSCRTTAVAFQDCLSTTIDLNCPVEQRMKSQVCLRYWARMNISTDEKREKTY